MDTRNYVLIGEAGSGKTEIAANLALLLARTQTLPVCLIDMDQTKCLFRARDFSSPIKRTACTYGGKPGVVGFAADAPGRQHPDP